MKTKESHDQLCTDIETDNAMEDFGVKTACCFTQHLEYFHTTSGFPLDILHDFLEGVIPVELIIKLIIRKKVFFSGTVESKLLKQNSFFRRQTIGGNGYENVILIRLLPTIIGTIVPVEKKLGRS